MFKKIHRVSSWLFKPLLKSKSYFSCYFRAKYRTSVDTLKISVVIPKKIIKKRVDRNALKRKILHYIKENIITDKNFHCVFWVSKNIHLIDKKVWQNDIDDLLLKIGIHKK